MIQAVDHVQIAIAPEHEQAALAFYGGVLRLPRLPKPPGAGAGGGWFKAGNIQVHIGIQREGFVPARKAHVGFEVDDLAALRAAIEAAGLPTQDGPQVPGRARFFAEDPAGNRLEFLQGA